jgi:hypothetical protein
LSDESSGEEEEGVGVVGEGGTGEALENEKGGLRDDTGRRWTRGGPRGPTGKEDLSLARSVCHFLQRPK